MLPGAAVVVAIGVTLFAILPPAWAIDAAGRPRLVCRPGIVLARRLYAACERGGGWFVALLAGPAWGYALSSVALLGLWAAGVRSVRVAAAGAAARRRSSSGRPAASLVALTLPVFTRRDVAAVALVLLAVTAIVGRPYSQVGRLLPEGRAYRAYFTADFVSNMSIVAEVSKGDVPPQNPYFRGDPLHYYWLMHLVPSAEYRAASHAISIEQALLVTALWMALAFAAFLYLFVRHFVDSPWAAATGVRLRVRVLELRGGAPDEVALGPRTHARRPDVDEHRRHHALVVPGHAR